MAKNPSFSFYVNDFEGGTRHMTDAELGCYVRLLLAQFNSKDGTLPDDEKFLQRFSDSFKESWPLVKDKFKKIGKGVIQNERMEQERVKRLLYTQHQSDNGKMSAKKRATSASTIVQPSKTNPFNRGSTNVSTKKQPARVQPLGNGYGIGNNKKGKVGMGGKDNLSHPVDGFFCDQLDKSKTLDELQIGATIQFIHLTCKVEITEKDVGDYWEAFKIRQFGAHEWYNSYEKLLTHFRNSTKLEIQKNGTHREISTGTAKPSGKSAGAVKLASLLTAQLTVKRTGEP